MAQFDTIFGRLRGRVGNTVFRSWGGKTFMYSRPCKPGKQSEAQKEHRHRFRAAATKAKYLLTDAATLEHYQQEAKRLQLPNAYTVLLRELMQKAEPQKIIG